MATLGDIGEYNGVVEWVDAFAAAVADGSAALKDVKMRAQVAANVLQAVRSCIDQSCTADTVHDKAKSLLSACRVFMRDRRGIDCLLTPEALSQFVSVAQSLSASWGAREEALKCVINSVYSRPEFVAGLLNGDGSSEDAFIPRMLALAAPRAPTSWHALVWKTLLVACDCPAVAHTLSQALDAWNLLYTTICYTVYDPEQRRSRAEPTDCMLIEMLKLVAVLVNEIKWSDGEAAASSAVLQTIYQLGELLLFISGSDASIDVKNRVAEVFLVLPPALTAAFVDKQREAGLDRPLEPILNHLEAMLVAVRVEKTSPIQDMLPILILCHNLTLAGNPSTVASFRAAVLPPDEAASASRLSRRATFLFDHLQFFLTCLDTDVKRFAGEWLYLLCDQNAEEYMRRTGIGKAIGMLRVKGLA